MTSAFIRLAASAVFATVVAGSALAADPLVSPQWLNDHKANGKVVVIDIRSAPADAYTQGHIPGAVHADYTKAGWRVARDGVAFMPPTAPQLEKTIGDLGIGNDSHVVVVSTGNNATDFGAAARVYWTLKYAGLKELSILDGGFAGWKAAGLSVETETRKPSPATFTAKLDDSILIDAPQVQTAIEKKSAVLVDSRPSSFFQGKEKAAASKSYGRLPGAVNVDSAKFYDPATNRLKPKAELEAAASEVPATGDTIAYCNTGHWAATDWFVLHEVLGRTNTRLYAGSMVEWTSKDGRPLASDRTKFDDLKKALGLGS